MKKAHSLKLGLFLCGMAASCSTVHGYNFSLQGMRDSLKQKISNAIIALKNPQVSIPLIAVPCFVWGVTHMSDKGWSTVWDFPSQAKNFLEDHVRNIRDTNIWDTHPHIASFLSGSTCALLPKFISALCIGVPISGSLAYIFYLHGIEGTYSFAEYMWINMRENAMEIMVYAYATLLMKYVFDTLHIYDKVCTHYDEEKNKISCIMKDRNILNEFKRIRNTRVQDLEDWKNILLSYRDLLYCHDLLYYHHPGHPDAALDYIMHEASPDNLYQGSLDIIAATEGALRQRCESLYCKSLYEKMVRNHREPYETLRNNFDRYHISCTIMAIYNKKRALKRWLKEGNRFLHEEEKRFLQEEGEHFLQEEEDRFLQEEEGRLQKEDERLLKEEARLLQEEVLFSKKTQEYYAYNKNHTSEEKLALESKRDKLMEDKNKHKEDKEKYEQDKMKYLEDKEKYPQEKKRIEDEQKKRAEERKKEDDARLDLKIQLKWESELRAPDRQKDTFAQTEERRKAFYTQMKGGHLYKEQKPPHREEEKNQYDESHVDAPMPQKSEPKEKSMNPPSSSIGNMSFEE